MENSNHLTESWSLSWQSVLSSQLWRLEHLYWIENKAGQLQRFSLNRAQRRLHERLWYRNDILKARQLGISTYVAMLMLDMSLFRSNFHCVGGQKSYSTAYPGRISCAFSRPGMVWMKSH